MNNDLLKLQEITLKKERLIIGLMSGTSLDGLDIALCKFTGSGKSLKISVLAFDTISYSEDFKKELKQICFVKTVGLEKICLMNKKIGGLHADWIISFLASNHYHAQQIDLIASHGQTIFHSPSLSRIKDDFGNATLQIGDADQIAVKTGIITLSDFRQKNIAQGQEGAPLAVYGDYSLFHHATENRVLLNIGGISNCTIIPKSSEFDQILSTDIGPGNTLMDQFIQKMFPKLSFDKDAEIASKGDINQKLLDEMLAHSFFEIDYPKSTGPELFNLNFLNDALLATGYTNLIAEDILATLNRFTAVCISKAILNYFNQEDLPFVYYSGGGAHNPLLVKNLKELLPFAQFKNTAQIGIHSDAKEAVLFALLANETIAGNYSSFGTKTLSMGKISLPN